MSDISREEVWTEVIDNLDEDAGRETPENLIDMVIDIIFDNYNLSYRNKGEEADNTN